MSRSFDQRSPVRPETTLAEATVAPEVGSPIDEAAMVFPASVAHDEVGDLSGSALVSTKTDSLSPPPPHAVTTAHNTKGDTRRVALAWKVVIMSMSPELRSS